MGEMKGLKEINFKNVDVEGMRRIGCEIGKNLVEGDLILLKGDLGSGKTILTKAIAEGMGIDRNRVKSPSFVLMNIYSDHLKLYHMDLYRLNDEDDFISSGLMEFLQPVDGVTVVEWADRISKMKLNEFLEITIDFEDEERRSVRLRAKGERFDQLIESLFKVGDDEF